jgi:ATP-dependent Clp protease ATP-binding subunit ClpB
LENALAKESLSGRFAPKDTIRIDAQGGVFSFDKA